MINRRDFLWTAGALACLPVVSWEASAKEKEQAAEVVIIGGGLGGVAAALAACRAGRRVILTEETDWIGGQSSAQAVPLDEHPWIEQFGCTRAYRAYRQAIRAYYRDHYSLTPEARENPLLNPGNGWVSRLCHEPRVSHAVLSQMLVAFLGSGQLRLLLEHRPVAAEVNGDRAQSVTVLDIRRQERIVLRAPYFIDATELGELLPLARVEYVIGAEAQGATGELHAPATAHPGDQQAFTCCFAMDYCEGEDHVIDKPAEYAFWCDYTPVLTPSWPGRLLSWQTSNPNTLKSQSAVFDPALKSGWMNWFTYRRLIDPANFRSGAFRSGITLVNWPQNDYLLGTLVDVPEEEAARQVARAKQLSLSLLYWMQTEAPRPDGGTGWKGLRLRPDVVGTADGLAKYPYIRESRRIRAEFTVTESHIGTDSRAAQTGRPPAETTAAVFEDSVGVGAYRIDLHASAGGTNFLDISCLPFQIPLGALLPQRMENLLPACKNLGTTHISNGAYRLHPVEWNIGEAAGSLAAYCLDVKEPPRQVRKDQAHLQAFQARLRQSGMELEWPRLRPL